MTTAPIEITKSSRRPKYQIVQLYFCIKQLMRGAITTSKCSELIQSPEDYAKRVIKTVEVMKVHYGISKGFCMCETLTSGRRFHLEINWMLNRNISTGSHATATEDGGGGGGRTDVACVLL